MSGSVTLSLSQTRCQVRLHWAISLLRWHAFPGRNAPHFRARARLGNLVLLAAFYGRALAVKKRTQPCCPEGAAKGTARQNFGEQMGGGRPVLMNQGEYGSGFRAYS